MSRKTTFASYLTQGLAEEALLATQVLGPQEEELRGMVAPMTEAGRRGILGENVARAYRLA